MDIAFITLDKSQTDSHVNVITPPIIFLSYSWSRYKNHFVHSTHSANINKKRETTKDFTLKKVNWENLPQRNQPPHIHDISSHHQ